MILRLYLVHPFSVSCVKPFRIEDTVNRTIDFISSPWYNPASSSCQELVTRTFRVSDSCSEVAEFQQRAKQDGTAKRTRWGTRLTKDVVLSGNSQPRCGTPSYMSPELISGRSYTGRPVDVRPRACLNQPAWIVGASAERLFADSLSGVACVSQSMTDQMNTIPAERLNLSAPRSAIYPTFLDLVSHMLSS